MIIASAISRVMAIVVISIAWAIGTRPVAAAELTSAYIVPVQLSMGGNLHTPVPAARKRMAAPAKPEAGLTPKEQKQLTEATNRLTPQERKRLAKALKRMTPEQRRQLAAIVKRQLAKTGIGSPPAKRAR
ncbi:MAG: hypothetical protein ABSF54_10035 [Bryobacteraceae bacterium]|jgi:hypothetical protein